MAPTIALAAAAVVLVVGGVLPASAATITFIPPNDTVGAVFTTNLNDGYEDGRGDVFAVDVATIIDSVGIFQDLTNRILNYSVYETLGTSGEISAGATLLRSGSTLATTTGLEWIDFSFAPLSLAAGGAYHIEFRFFGESNQNFFYNNDNVPFPVGPFSLVDGTHDGDTSNYVMPAIRLNTADATPIPEPMSLTLLGSGLLGLVARRRRARK